MIIKIPSVIINMLFPVCTYSVTLAVVNYQPKDNSSVLENAENYVNFLRKYDDFELLVFPESGLFSKSVSGHQIEPLYYTPVVLHEIPCTQKTPNLYPRYIRLLSCAARNYNTTLVINTIEKEDDHHNLTLFNTNLVLGHRGQLIAKYRKHHLHGEHTLSSPKTPDISIFTTANGYTFGMLTCFDILFNEPTKALLQRGIQRIVFPTNWISELPFLTALQMQQMWAHSHNTFLMAAGRAGTGSGIYLGQFGVSLKAINYQRKQPFIDLLAITIDERSKSHTYFQYNNMHHSDKNHQFGSLTIWREDLSNYKSEILLLNRSIYQTVLCDKNVCCEFLIETDKAVNSFSQKTTYQMLVYVGKRPFSNGEIYAAVEVCALVACANEFVTSCNQLVNVDSSIIFHRLRITKQVLRDSKEIMHYPNTLLNTLEPLNPADLNWVTTYNSKSKISTLLDLVNSQRNLITFAIYGRDFSSD